MQDNTWFKIGETQELAPCTDEELGHNSSPRLPTEQIAIVRDIQPTSHITIRIKPVLVAGGTTLEPKQVASRRAQLAMAAGAIAAGVVALLALV